MTQKEKRLLIKDLCARLPYSILGLHRGEDLPLDVMDDSGAYMVLDYDSWFNLDTVPFKPYLRPLSSMTAAEEYEYHQYKNIDYPEICEMEHAEMLCVFRVQPIGSTSTILTIEV